MAILRSRIVKFREIFTHKKGERCEECKPNFSNCIRDIKPIVAMDDLPLGDPRNVLSFYGNWCYRVEDYEYT